MSTLFERTYGGGTSPLGAIGGTPYYSAAEREALLGGAKKTGAVGVVSKKKNALPQQIGGHLAGLQETANAANEARYQKLMELAQQFGVTQQRQNQQLTQQQLAGGTQGLISRGLGNSTVLDTMQQGILRQGQDRGMDIGQRVAELQMGPVERRQDVGPNLGMYANLLATPGAMGGAMGGGSASDMLAALFGIKR
jgi:hypothetical protein